VIYRTVRQLKNVASPTNAGSAELSDKIKTLLFVATGPTLQVWEKFFGGGAAGGVREEGTIT